MAAIHDIPGMPEDTESSKRVASDKRLLFSKK
jgi:hypothetical protein